MHPPEKIGLIAGQGEIPRLLLSRWEHLGFIPVVVGLDGITPPDILQGRISATFSIGQAGHILKFLKQQGVHRLVMVGGLTRPNFWTLRTDMTGIRIVFNVLFRRVGDDRLLRHVRRVIEQQGISVVGVHHFLPELLCPVGVLGGVSPDDSAIRLIEQGVRIAKEHGAEDKGQSVIISQLHKPMCETKSGTDAMIESWRDISNASHGDVAVMVKVSKPQQDMDIDLPTIGPPTIKAAVRAGLKGIALESGKTMISNQNEVIRLADAHGLFIVGVE